MFEHKILPNNFFIFYVQSLALNLLISTWAKRSVSFGKLLCIEGLFEIFTNSNLLEPLEELGSGFVV